MDEDINFFGWQVPDLKKYLQERGIQCSLRRKIELVRLCELANELHLEILTTNVENEYVDFDRKRRSVTFGSQNLVLEPINKVQDWNRDLSKIPDVESFDVLVYLLNKCGWNSDRLTNYKMDNGTGYRLHMANHIDNVQASYGLHPEFMYLKCTCVPETRQSAEPYTPWILLQSSSGEIISGGCTCVADNGSCKHCMALLFALSSFCGRHQDRSAEVCTDVPCTWDKPRKATMPSEISYIDTRIDQANPPPILPTPDNYDPRVPSQRQEVTLQKDFYNLCKGTDSLLLQTLYCDEMESEGSDSEDTVTMEDAFKTKGVAGDMHCMNEKLKEIFNSEQINQIEEDTRGQSVNPAWFLHRKGRITASVFSSVKHFRFIDSQENYISKQIMGKSNRITTPSMSFGTLNEPIARHQYFQEYKQFHKQADIILCGLFIDPDFPYLGASPDALVKCKCCGEGLLEIKCSFVHQNKDPREACMDNHYHVTLDENENVHLKIDSPWYVQIQGQLGVCHKKWCDFVFFTKKGFIVDRIYFDEELYRNIVIKAGKFFEKYIVPALLSSD